VIIPILVLHPYFFAPEGARARPQRYLYLLESLEVLAAVPVKNIHRPWAAPLPPRHYPPPIVEHAFARGRFLAAASVL
jgi:deoxyribodipyrimidine photolyase